MPGKNPYRPGVGTRPAYLAGRDDELARFRSILKGAPEIPGNVRLTGLRGVGKTVLLGEYKDLARSIGWATIDLELEARHNSTDDLSRLVKQAADRLRSDVSVTERVRKRAGKAANVLRDFRVEYDQLTFSFAGFEPDGTNDLSVELGGTVGRCMNSGYEGLALLLDEAQVLKDDRDSKGQHPLSMLLASVSALQKQEVPIVLVLCGLPTLTTNLLEARTYAERMFRGQRVGSLNRSDSEDAFLAPLNGTGVTPTTPLIQRVLDAVEGYPYFVQLWGAELWDAADRADVTEFTVDLLDEVEGSIFERLDEDFYEPRVVSLTPAEQDLLTVSGRCGYPPLITAHIVDGSKKRPNNVNVLLGRLCAAGVLYRVRKGEYEYTAPKFYDFLQRRAEQNGDGSVVL